MQTVEANGASIPVLGMGTWTLKGQTCAELVSHALKVGYRHIDTAAAYDNEEAVGEGIRASGVKRDDIFLTTKVWWKDIAGGDLERSAEASVARLGVDQVDLLLIHWPNPAIDLAESLKALNRVRASGAARHIGVSNFPTALLAEAVRLSEAPLVANQVEYHPFLNQDRVYAACQAEGMAMVSYCPLARGGDLFSQPEVAGPAKRYGKTPAQIVLRWHVQQEGVIAIPRTSNPARLAENADIFDFLLSDEEMRAVSALRQRGNRICDYDFSPVWDPV
ncbi:aldo/keto reductase [Nitratireductor kimnyeongensis]|uniref:Aldo/keto reductase n=1 Tax=Nitratireductor kimnyeongensis TaxID=430679 RepID=A0ABW0T3G0_9HYPH|nr:aldo/keto reductase [Nitratireductor kimnyeongensis]QZZ35274.1 aldo/keto reductase [Nitratireductor kimnyeongensis]